MSEIEVQDERLTISLQSNSQHRFCDAELSGIDTGDLEGTSCDVHSSPDHRDVADTS